MSRRDLVIFDCDGVLIDSEVISARMLVKELTNYDIHVDLAYVVRHFLGRSYPVVLSQIKTDFGVLLPDGFEADYRARLLTSFSAHLTVMPHVREVIEGLRVPYCLATSSSPARLRHSMQIVGLSALFEGRSFTSSEVSRGKPAPDLFLHAAAKMGAAPERCLVIEDSLSGVRAGLSAGMEVWRFVGGSHLAGLDTAPDTGENPHQQFSTFAEFFGLAPDLQTESGPDGAPI